MILTVHDELLFEAPEGEAGAVAEFVRDLMERAYPLACHSPSMSGSARTGTTRSPDRVHQSYRVPMSSTLAPIVVAAAMTGAVVAWAQQPPGVADGATLSGTVVDAGTRQPIRGAIVGASVVRSAEIGFITGSDGRFVLKNVPPGTINFYATKAGYFDGFYGRRRPGAEGERLTVVAGEAIDKIELLMWPVALISGTVTNEAGEPIPSVVVRATRRPDPPAGRPPSHAARTDENGRYVLDNLNAGDYTVGIGVAYSLQTEQEAAVHRMVLPATPGRDVWLMLAPSIPVRVLPAMPRR